jgi:hypothetical protein
MWRVGTKRGNGHRRFAARVAAMPAAKFRRGGETHVHDDYPVVTPGLGTGDFEGCARPSQPTIGIAAVSLPAS